MSQEGYPHLGLYFSHDNGETWETAKVDGNYTSTIYGATFYSNNKFYVLMSSNISLISTNAKTFQVHATNRDLQGFPAMFSNSSGTYVFSFSYVDGSILISADGIYFERYKPPQIMNYVEWCTHALVLCNFGTPNCIRSTDGIKWKTLHAQKTFGEEYSKASYYDGPDSEIVAVVSLKNASLPKMFRTFDFGETWTLVQTWYDRSPWFIWYAGGHYITYFNSDLGISEDLDTWTNPKLPFDASANVNLYPVNNGKRLFFALQAGYEMTDDWVTWIKPPLGVLAQWNKLFVLSSGEFILEASNEMKPLKFYDSKYYSTTDGSKLNALPSPDFSSYYISNYKTDLYAVISRSKMLYITRDFQTWESYNCPAGIFSDIWGIMYGNNTWVIVGSLGDSFLRIYTTTDLNGKWTVSYEAQGYHWASGDFGNDIFVVQIDGNVFTSNDGNKWSPQPGRHFSYSYVSFKGGLFFMRANNGFSNPPPFYEVSQDGSHWLNVTLSIKNDISYAALDHTYVAYDVSGNILTSPDGVFWKYNQTLSISGQISTRASLVGLQYNGNWLAISSKADVLVGN
eukprot:Phypoly_transcript_06316.p1 GENE.Phypoly_transcript_06316~~Phypoly_transcript_06316.p1  ORF type:complete len:586 (+),score=46.30 Phypoly_transcript_06316:56-1759(+)